MTAVECLKKFKVACFVELLYLLVGFLPPGGGRYGGGIALCDGEDDPFPLPPLVAEERDA